MSWNYTVAILLKVPTYWKLTIERYFQFRKPEKVMESSVWWEQQCYCSFSFFFLFFFSPNLQIKNYQNCVAVSVYVFLHSFCHGQYVMQEQFFDVEKSSSTHDLPIAGKKRNVSAKWTAKNLVQDLNLASQIHLHTLFLGF